MSEEKHDEKKILELLVHRLNGLMKQGYTMEAVFLMGMYLEQKLSQVIQLYEHTLQQTAQERGIRYLPQKSRSRKIEKMSLGQLHSLFVTYNDNKEINDALNEFIGFRNRIAHKLNSDNLSTEMKVNTPSIRGKIEKWCALISDLNAIGRKITQQNRGKVKRYVVRKKDQQ